jgi:hypothetical protein
MMHRPLVRLALSLLLLAGLRGHAATPVGTAAPLGDAQLHDPDTPARSPALRADPPALALAEVYSPGIDLADYLVSEKLDGVRAYWDGRRLVTRGGLVIQAPAWFTAGFPDVALDGELWMGRGRFAALSGTVRRLEPDQDAWRGVRYMLFDLPGHSGDFATRLGVLRDLVAAAPSPHGDGSPAPGRDGRSSMNITRGAIPLRPATCSAVVMERSDEPCPATALLVKPGMSSRSRSHSTSASSACGGTIRWSRWCACVSLVGA